MVRRLLETLKLNTNVNITEELPKIAAPTLIVHGGQDASAPLELTGRKPAALIDRAFSPSTRVPDTACTPATTRL